MSHRFQNSISLGNVVGALDDGAHIRRQVGILSAAAGEDDHGGIGEGLSLVHHCIGVVVHGGLGQGPILLSHVDNRAVSAPHLGAIVIIHLRQGIVGFVACAVQGGHDVYSGLRQVTAGCGAGAGEHGMGGGPAKDIQLLFIGTQGQQAIVLHQNHALLGHLLNHAQGVAHHVIGDFCLGGIQKTGDDGIHRAVANHVNQHNDHTQESNHGSPANHQPCALFRPAGGNQNHNQDDKRTHHGIDIAAELCQVVCNVGSTCTHRDKHGREELNQ